MIIVFLKMCILNVIGTVDFSMFDLAICFLVLNLGVCVNQIMIQNKYIYSYQSN